MGSSLAAFANSIADFELPARRHERVYHRVGKKSTHPDEQLDTRLHRLPTDSMQGELRCKVAFQVWRGHQHLHHWEPVGNVSPGARCQTYRLRSCEWNPRVCASYGLRPPDYWFSTRLHLRITWAASEAVGVSAQTFCCNGSGHHRIRSAQVLLTSARAEKHKRG